jgi:hypothetical protein
MKVLKMWKKQRKGAAEEVDAATKTETPASNTTTAAPVQTGMSGTVVDVCSFVLCMY